MSTWPPAGVSSPATAFSKVDLPQPVGPTMETNALSATVSEVGETARNSEPERVRNAMLTSVSRMAKTSRACAGLKGNTAAIPGHSSQSP